MPPRRAVILLLALLGASAASPAAQGAAPPAAQEAARHAGPATAVELGDSYMSGEGARWLGNSADTAGSRDGTDRACSPSIDSCTSYDPTKVYLGNSYADGCHRADVAQIVSSHLPLTAVNIACSGAVSSDLFLARNGGSKDHGETPQGDQLLALARTHNVRFIAVMIGGNDLNFATIVSACFQAYETKGTPCSQTQSGQVSPAALKVAQLKVEKAIDNVRQAMRLAGYHIGDYRMVLEDYPVVIPRAADARYAEGDPNRTVNGCPFYDADMNWAQTTAGPRIDAMVIAAAAARGVPLLDMSRAFAGHEICAKTDSSVTPLQPPSATGSEWGRAVSGSAIAEGQTQELFHPDAYGHMAFGVCLHEFYVLPVARNYACAGRAGISPQEEQVSPGKPLAAECRIGRIGTSGPRLKIAVSCNQVAGLRATVTRGARRLLASTIDLPAGRRTIELRLPSGLRAPIKLTLVLRGTGGDVRRFSRTLAAFT